MDIDLRDLLGSQQGLTVNRRPFSLACLGKGSTTFPSKLESLLWQIMLETAYDENPEACVLKYAKQVISITTDQGVESLVGQAPTLSIEQFLKDVAADLKAKPKIDKQSALEDEMDLCLVRVFSWITYMLSSYHLKSVMVEPVCAIFSLMRRPALRSKLSPFGFDVGDETRIGNILALRAIAIIQICHALFLPALLSSPGVG